MQGCAQGAGPGPLQAGVQCPIWAITATTLDGVSAMGMHSTTPWHVCNLAQTSPAFPLHPLQAHEGPFSLLLQSLGGRGW